MQKQCMAPDKDTLGRASLLAAELIGICRRAEKPLAADYIQVAMEQLTAGTDFAGLRDCWDPPISDRSPEN
jgi:hypothetical protein